MTKRLLELFSGTGSVGKVAKYYGYEVISLDLQGADINIDILDWDYKKYPRDYFSVVWASPPCRTFSILRGSHIGRSYKNGNSYTKESIEKDMIDIGLPILRKTEEIIDYFNCKNYFIENPATGKMKQFINRPKIVVDYCKYSNWGYRKRTAIWTNLEGWKREPLCKQNCSNCVNGKHLINFGITKKSKNYRPQVWTTINDRYRIPPMLLSEIFNTMIINDLNKLID